MRDELQQYLNQVPDKIKNDVNNILRIKDNEERWTLLFSSVRTRIN